MRKYKWLCVQLNVCVCMSVSVSVSLFRALCLSLCALERR